MSVFREAIEVCRRLGVECFTISLAHLDEMDKALDMSDQSAAIVDLKAQLETAQRLNVIAADVSAHCDSLQAQLETTTKALADKSQQYSELFAVNQTQAATIEAATASADKQAAQIVELTAEIETLKLGVPDSAAKPADAPV